MPFGIHYDYYEYFIVLASRFSETAILTEPRIMSTEKVYKVQEGGKVILECNVHNLDNMVLMWKQVGTFKTFLEMFSTIENNLELSMLRFFGRTF